MLQTDRHSKASPTSLTDVWNYEFNVNPDKPMQEWIILATQFGLTMGPTIAFEIAY